MRFSLPILNATWSQLSLYVSKSFNPDDQPTGQGLEISLKFAIVSYFAESSEIAKVHVVL